MDGDKRKSPVTVGLVIAGAALVYVASIGPAGWASSRWGGARFVNLAYKPLTWTLEASGSRSLMDVINRYSELRADRAYTWSFNPKKPGSAKWQSVFDVEEYMAAEQKIFIIDPTAATGMPKGASRE
jgi:hypothetical protein